MGVVVAPWDPVVFGPEGIFHAVGKGMHDGLVEVSPNKLCQPFFAVREPLTCHVADAHGAKPQMNADPRSASHGGSVSRFCVLLQQLRFDIGFWNGHLAGREAHLLQAWHPFVLPLCQLVKVLFRRRSFHVVFRQIGMPPFAEWREYGVGRAIGLHNLPRCLDHMVFEGVQENVLRTQSLRQESISLQGVGLIVFIGVDPTNIEFGNEFEENVMGVSVGHIDVRTLGLCFSPKDRHAVVQEGHPGVLLVLQMLQNVFVKNEEQQHLMTRGQGCMEGTVVVPTKVPAEPMDDQRRRGKGSH